MRLPSTRALAIQLNVSRNTVLNAYQQLIAEGYFDGLVGNGTFVARVLPDHLLTSPQLRDLAETSLAEPDNAAIFRPGYAATPCSPHADGDARSIWRITASFSFWCTGLAGISLQTLVTAAHSPGKTPANQCVYLSACSGEFTSARSHCRACNSFSWSPLYAGQIIIVSGAQEGLELAARLLINAGDPVWMEDPGYLKARGHSLDQARKLSLFP